MIANEYPPKVMRIGIVFPNRICSTYRQLAIWESTVAIAAPRTPRCRTKINTGSSSRFKMCIRDRNLERPLYTLVQEHLM